FGLPHSPAARGPGEGPSRHPDGLTRPDRPPGSAPKPGPTADLSPARLEPVPPPSGRQKPLAAAPAAPAASWLDHLAWRPVVASSWLAGSVGWLGCVAVRVGRFRRALRCASPAPGPIQRRAEDLAGRLGLGRVPGVWIVPG